MKKKIISFVLLVTLVINGFGVFANTMNVDQAWNKLSVSQQSKLKEVGMDIDTLNKIDAELDGIDIGDYIHSPLTYKDDKFIISNSKAESVLELLSIATGTEFDGDKMMVTFNDVIGDINQNSSVDTKRDFAKLLSQYGMISSGEEGLPGGQEVPDVESLTKEEIKEQLESKMEAFKQKEEYANMEKVHFQKTLETLSGYMTKTVTALTSESVQEAWSESIKWQEENSNQVVFDKVSTPVAQIDVDAAKEVIIPENLWNDTYSFGQIRLNIGSVGIYIDKSTYSNGASKLIMKPVHKEGYGQALNISNTSKMSSPVKISFNIEDENPEDYAIYKLEEDKEIIIGGVYNPACESVEALVKSSGTYAIKKAPYKTYNDLKDFDWAKEEIERLGQKGYVSGKSEGIYAPQDEITRAEFAVLLARTLQLPGSNDKTKFKDLEPNAWYYNDVMATVRAELFSGKSSSSFDPNGKITRQEVTAVISRILMQKGYDEPKLEMKEEAIWAPGALYLIKQQFRTEDIPGFNDNVTNNANRAEVAYLLYNLIQR